MKNLNFGCKRSDFLVTNSKDDWFIQCRFYEPDREKPFTYRRRLNRFKDEIEKTKIAKLLLKQMKSLLDEKDYNPRTKQFMFLEEELNPNLSLCEALQKALASKTYTPEHMKLVEFILNRFKTNTIKLELDYLKIKDVELIHIKKILEACNLSNYGYNQNRKVLSSLFTDLVDESCLKVNPCTGIKPKKHIVEKKEIFTDKDLERISERILRDVPLFYNFFQIFYMSGCRVPEMIGLKAKDVNLEKQEYTILLKKGDLYVREKRAIVPDAMEFWQRQMKKVKGDQYIFSYGFIPGDTLLTRDYVYKFWKKKIRIGTIYQLKYTWLDKVEEAHYNAQIMAGHRDDRTTSIYTVGREKRRLEAQKQIKINSVSK
ncbi:tyrosine-type recombinase/integrase [Chryseobacterium sp. SIMBA_028]|uniref:tyrosine-type recombinase/integrase n=1 Tax=Chryseobacterium sp. SIMBA_028 TaxID=3085771 RepID=UPI00397A4D2F